MLSVLLQGCILYYVVCHGHAVVNSIQPQTLAVWCGANSSQGGVPLYPQRRRSWARVAWLLSTAPAMPLGLVGIRLEAETLPVAQVSGSLGEVAVKVSKFKNLPVVAGQEMLRQIGHRSNCSWHQVSNQNRHVYALHREAQWSMKCLHNTEDPRYDQKGAREGS